MRYLFGPFELDTDRFLLRRSGEKLHLEPRVLDLLTYLVEHPDRVISKDELVREVWSGAFITDGALKRAVLEARRVLGDSGDRQSHIQTVYGRGYLFAAEVEALGSPQAPSGKQRVAARWAWILGGLSAALVLVVSLNLSGWKERLLGRRASPAPIDSVAVLPLENLSGDPGQEYLADGMTEALISRLGAIPELKVISRTSMMRYKGTDKSAPEIARELDVDVLLEGSVLRAGDEVRIAVQLIDGRNDTHLWAESYRRTLTDILSLHSEVARATAGAIRLRLTPHEEEALLAGVRKVDPEAYEAYLKGKFHLDQRTLTPPGLQKATAHLQRALELDPALAPAHAAVGRLHFNLAIGGAVPPTEAMPLARQSALRALEIDEGSVEGHVLMGLVHAGYDLDLPAARSEAERALELNPNHPGAHWLHAGYFVAMGELERALVAVRTAWRLDPFDALYGIGEAWCLVLLGREDEAQNPLRRSLEQNSEFAFAHAMLSTVLMRQGLAEEGIRELQAYYRLVGLPEAADAVEEGYRVEGVEGAFRRAAMRMEEMTEERFVSPSEIAAAYARGGRPNEAFEFLEQAVAARDSFLWQLRRDLTLEALHSDPRFDELTGRLGLPE